MRVRILREPNGDIDGVSLAAFHEGRIYEVSSSIGSYLVLTGDAEPMVDDAIRRKPEEPALWPLAPSPATA